MLSSEALQCIHLLPVFIFKTTHSSCHPGADSGRPSGQRYLRLLFCVRNAVKSHQASLGLAARGAWGYTTPLRKTIPKAAGHDLTEAACPSLPDSQRRGPASHSPLSGIRLLGQERADLGSLQCALLRLLEGHVCWVKSICFSRSSLLLATAGYSEMVMQSIL